MKGPASVSVRGQFRTEDAEPDLVTEVAAGLKEVIGCFTSAFTLCELEFDGGKFAVRDVVKSGDGVAVSFVKVVERQKRVKTQTWNVTAHVVVEPDKCARLELLHERNGSRELTTLDALVGGSGVTLVMRDWYCRHAGHGTRDLFGSRALKEYRSAVLAALKRKLEERLVKRRLTGADRRDVETIHSSADSLATLLLCDSSETMNILQEVKQLRMSARPVLVESLPSKSFDDIDTMAQGKRE